MIELDEVTSADAVELDSYTVIFVDEASYGRDVAELLGKFEDTKKVFISYRNDAMRGFDVTIKKPFLPSQIIELLQDTSHVENLVVEDEDILMEEESVFEAIPSIFPLPMDDEEKCEIQAEEEVLPPTILDGDEIEKIKALLDMDDNLELTDEILSDEEREARKIEVIKEQLIADGLEIVDESEIVEELSIGLDGTLNASNTTKKKEKKKNKSKKLKFTDETMETIEDAVEMTMASMTKKQMKKLLKGKEIEVKIKLEDKH